ncbi:MAG: CDP-diacylglycerol--glycerol-3-phosphate 3-phosphatidyltransferase, partial [Methylophaga sp.]|nr:CDP-diacylglycerol--glycerol-3-phosphate 3-phosphatidyltransferase [Methylophaga sp.]
MFNLPNILSLLRIALIPVLIGCYFLPSEYASIWATIVFAIASLTDWLDGYLARKWNQTSPFGAFIDPVADKLIVAIALVLV